ncbi:MAG TPA: NAD-dependent epimerase/dehydratase family protein, partial [Nitrospira sp.]|nr:NAD-dependent epimerase/dehydratase family protein [Nitrospira sp.]
MPEMERDARIYVAGHRGMVGSAIVRLLEQRGYRHIICRTSRELDLRDGREVAAFFSEARPDYVFVAAAKVGGILANDSLPADFLYDNLAIETHLIHQAYRHKVR